MNKNNIANYTALLKDEGGDMSLLNLFKKAFGEYSCLSSLNPCADRAYRTLSGCQRPPW